MGEAMTRLRDWIGTAATIGSALIEHWLGETVAVAVLTAAVAIFGGILWRRVSLLMAAPRPNPCTKAYEVESRLVNYMAIMAPLAPIVEANQTSTANAQFLAGLKSVGPPSGPDSAPSSYNQSWGQDVTGVLNGIIATVGSAGIW